MQISLQGIWSGIKSGGVVTLEKGAQLATAVNNLAMPILGKIPALGAAMASSPIISGCTILASATALTITIALLAKHFIGKAIQQ